MTNDKLEEELDKPAINAMVIIITYMSFGVYGMIVTFLFFTIGYIYQYYKNRDWLYKEKLFRYFLYTSPIYVIFPLLWATQ
jgi:4-hydroxybenzoate polyprenyltransferase